MLSVLNLRKIFRISKDEKYIFKKLLYHFQEKLTSKSIEMRLFERCFLVKMQGKAPTESMEGIDMLLRDTYNEILSLTTKFKELKANMKK